MNKIYQMNGYQLHLSSSKKFKDITISVRFLKDVLQEKQSQVEVF